MHILISFFIFILSSSLSFADYTEACFEDSKIAGHAQRNIAFLKTNTDKILLRGGCLKIETSTSRINLYQKYLRKNYTVSFTDLSTSIPTSNCVIELRKVLESKEQKKNASLKSITQQFNKNQNIQTSKITLSEGLQSEISYQNEKYLITCYKKHNGYNIQITSVYESLGLKTNRFVAGGEEIELGEVISKARSNDVKLESLIFKSSKISRVNSAALPWSRLNLLINEVCIFVISSSSKK